MLQMELMYKNCVDLDDNPVSKAGRLPEVK